jgi:two-component system response regulator
MSRTGFILVVEDSPDDQELFRIALKKNGIAREIRIASDGIEACDLLFGSETMPDLILLDLNLPKLDGVGVLQRIRADARTRHIPVVVLSSSREQDDVARCYSAGANSYVQKPIDFTEFVSTTQTLGRYWLELNQAWTA